MKKIVVFTFLLSLFVACEKLSESTLLMGELTLNDTIDISCLKSIYNEEEQLILRFDSVLNDSRCPVGAQCFWEGMAQTRFSLEREEEAAQSFDLSVNSAIKQDILIGEYRIQILGLSPYPALKHKISQRSYTASIIVSKE